MYGLRMVSKPITPIKRILRENDIKHINPYINIFSSFCNYNNNDWMYILNLNNKILGNNLKPDEYHTHINNLIENYYNNLCNDSFLYIDNYSNDVLNDCIKQLFYNIKEYNNNLHHIQSYNKHSAYQSIQIDNTEYYTLRLIHIPGGIETPIHNHTGLCMYALMNDINAEPTINNELLREIKYINSNINEDINKRIITRYIDKRDINLLYTNEYHQLKSENNDCYLLNLYIHGLDVRREYISY
jgi:hypothetical protein